MITELNNWFNLAATAVDQRIKQESLAEPKHEQHRDIIGLMLREMKSGDRLTREEILSNSILIVAAGGETTSTCLSATIYHLCKTPRVMRTLTTEIRQTFGSNTDITLKALMNLPYLNATIDESLRIFPVAGIIAPRMTPAEGHVIDGKVVPGRVWSTPPPAPPPRARWIV